ncbi:hypothetical protein DYY67_2069 [Candidatus Nitrosotalea sp. TS]|uniref:hypothetical protein n=1 Tax=Candidatus Nitrosotalea sp. TS TaxID=2341020 RepID=UPI001409DDBF|nr:hypothetical protein [Candidatus Nitrosotalea sp. TS]NHI04497.1 hypothetical protein [Candidatus Nitrosotalea sp. TS]
MKIKQDENSKNMSRSKKSKLLAIGVVIAIAIGIAVLMEYQTTKTLTGNAYTNPPMDSMGMMHFHPQLTFVVDGKQATVPAQIGIDPTLWNDHSLDSYGMTGMAPLHTHDTSGTIHVESYANRYYTFGEFLGIWGLNMGGYNVFMTVNGQTVSDYKNYILHDGDKIVLSLSTK